MVILIITLLLVASLVLVLEPVLRRRTVSGTPEDTAQRLTENLRRERDRIYEELRVLQQERFLRHLTDEEYQAQQEAARLRAALLLRQQQQVQETVAGLDQELESAISQAKQDQQSAGSQS